MSYRLYLAGELMPLPPAKLTMKIVNQNKTVTLLSGREVSQIKPAGLTEVDFDLLLPRRAYPFTQGGGLSAEGVMRLLERLKNGQKPFQFLLCRGAAAPPTDLTVTLEDYELTEEAGDGGDLRARVRLRQYGACRTRTVTLTGDGGAATAAARESNDREKVKEYQVKKGDCLWNIAKKYLGDGSRYKEIYALNRDKIQHPNLIYVGQVLRLPDGEGE